MANANKMIKQAVGTTALSLGITCKLAELDLSIAEVVFCGATALSNEFVKTSDINIGDSILKEVPKGAHKLSKKLIKKAKELFF